MKILLLSLVITMLSSCVSSPNNQYTSSSDQSHSDNLIYSYPIAISAHSVFKENQLGINELFDVQYSMYTGHMNRDLTNVDLDTLCKELQDFVIWGGVLPVSLHSKYPLSPEHIKKINHSIGMNFLLRLVYIENGINHKWGEYVKKKLEVK